MTGNSPVVLDACVLIPMPLADTLLRLAARPELFAARWTDQIMEEVNRNLISRFGLTAEKAEYRAAEIRRHFPEAWVEAYEPLIPTLTTHEKDRHVLAAAIRCGAEVIVTYNLKDFPPAALSAWSISAVGPSAFLRSLYQSHREAVIEVLEQQAATIRRPLAYLLERLRINVPGFVAAFDASL